MATYRFSDIPMFLAFQIHAAQDPAPKLSEAPPTKSALDATKPHDADVSPKWLEEAENAVTAGTSAEVRSCRQIQIVISLLLPAVSRWYGFRTVSKAENEACH